MADGLRQAGSGIACSRARARLNCSSHGRRLGRCRVRRRAERVSRPAREKNRRRRVLVVTICLPGPIRAVQRARLWAITWARQPGGVGGEAARGHIDHVIAWSYILGIPYIQFLRRKYNGFSGMKRYWKKVD